MLLQLLELILAGHGAAGDVVGRRTEHVAEMLVLLLERLELLEALLLHLEQPLRHLPHLLLQLQQTHALLRLKNNRITIFVTFSATVLLSCD